MFLLGLFVLLLFLSIVTVQQGTVAITTFFGKYMRTMYPGLNFRIPLLEVIFKRISVQNRAAELTFQAVTSDQANVHFTSLLLFAVMDNSEETVKKVAFKFVSDRDFMATLTRTVEGSIRAYVAGKKQQEILSLRREITEAVKGNVDHMLEDWGYHLIDLQINDITFDDEVMRSMSKIVAANNLKAAAENEGQALLITKTKAAEAEGNAIKIAAEAEREAAKMRGQAVALFREEVARGMSQAAKEMQNANLDTSVILFSMWTEAVKNFTEHGKGNVIFLDGSVDGMQKTMKEMMALTLLDTERAKAAR
ncbi:MAG TPA: SPFH domain-containing protein [Saprospiraceae bacterium]|nr:SPFH domain-containing protein [Saprospiraceae bacterium]HNG89233.1 SPFH domain-containing protein [Saprospiraceae bacterium]